MDREDRKRFCVLMREALPDEDKTPKMYGEMQELLEASDNPGFRALAISMEMIKKDEQKHYVALEHINRLVCSTLF